MVIGFQVCGGGSGAEGFDLCAPGGAFQPGGFWELQKAQNATAIPGLAEGENPESTTGRNASFGGASRVDCTPPARPFGSGFRCAAPE
ncbi:MAG: hypothetical protein WAP03_12970 [Methylorubrum rhodinum]|uniref:hypothetical protein n=1 Tax=Methylorubrum rhodinum TaxID=29428 RepID=UPI003BB16C8C